MPGETQIIAGSLLFGVILQTVLNFQAREIRATTTPEPPPAQSAVENILNLPNQPPAESAKKLFTDSMRTAGASETDIPAANTLDRMISSTRSEFNSKVAAAGGRDVERSREQLVEELVGAVSGAYSELGGHMMNVGKWRSDPAVRQEVLVGLLRSALRGTRLISRYEALTSPQAVPRTC